MIEKRLKRFQEAIPEGVDAVLLTADHSRRYLSGFDASDDYLFLTPSAAYFLADFRYYEAASKNVLHMETVLPAVSALDTVNELISRHRVKTLALEDREVTVASWQSLEKKLNASLVSLGNVVERLRQRKDEEELECIRKAQNITDAAFSHMLSFIKAGMTERDVKAELQHTQAKLGSEADSFDPIVISGKNTSLPHGVSGDKTLENGEFLTMDFGSVVKGYHSDMTRTVAIGEPTDEMISVYNTVLKAQENALSHIHIGLTGKQCDAFAREVIETAGYAGYFGHSLGHSVGLLIHETPCFSPKSQEIIEEGNVITVEPGIYLPDQFGVRIEDMVFMTDNGPVNLTKSPKDLIIIK